jgi:GxxExxY protein
MLYRDITERILGACFDVMNELGAGFLESVYEKALLVVFRERGLKPNS